MYELVLNSAFANVVGPTGFDALSSLKKAQNSRVKSSGEFKLLEGASAALMVDRLGRKQSLDIAWV